MVIKDCILKASEILRASGADTPVLDARVLMCFSLDKSDVFVITNPNEPISKSEEEQFFELVKRRAEHEPIAYITGEKEFMSLKFYVDSNVLIPRPDTEHLAELAIEIINKNNLKNVADFCTGSGALAISIAKACPYAHITGYDISDGALQVANKNKQLLKADNVQFYKTDILKELNKLNTKFDIVVSNPPYIDSDDMKKLEKSVSDYEPHLALFGGDDGLDFYKIITEKARAFLNDGGILAFEVGHTQATEVAHLMENNFNKIQIKKDYANIERVVWGILK